MLARARLQDERKAWRRDHPFGFHAKPVTRTDGTQDLLRWTFKIPTPVESIWYPAVVQGALVFTDDYPAVPPAVFFDKIADKPLFHPNVFPSGRVCLSIVNPTGSKHAYGDGGSWNPSLGIQTVLVCLQKSLDESSGYAEGSLEAYKLRTTDFDAYKRRVRDQVTQMMARDL